MSEREELRKAVVEEYKQVAKDLLRQGESRVSATREAGAHVYEEFEDIPNRTLRRWTKHLRDDRGMFDRDVEDDIFDESEEGDTLKELYLDEDYVYNEDDGTYIVFLESAPEPLVIPEEKHKAIIQAYSNWDGNKSTISEVTRQFPFLNRKLFYEYKKIFDLTHDHEPFTEEELMERDVEDLAEDAKQMKRHVLEKEFKKKEWQQTKKDANKFRRLDVYLRRPLERMIEGFAEEYDPPVINIGDAKREEFSLVMSMFDLHFGNRGWTDLNGAGYTMEEAKKRLKQKTESIIGKVKDKGLPEEIVCLFGGDFFDVDGKDFKTTSGTPRDVDATWAEIIDEGNRLAVSYVDMLRQVADKVHVYVVPGNHDEQITRTLLNYLGAWYRQTDDVEVDDSRRSRKYHAYGENLIVAEHGRISRTRLVKAIPQEARKLWGQTEQTYVFVGDKHHEKTVVEDDQKTLIYQVPTLKADSDWATREGYKAVHALSAYLIQKESGIDSIEYAKVKEPK